MRNLIAFCCFLILLAGIAFADNPGITTDDLKKLDKGRVVTPVTLFDNGDMLLMSESEVGGDYRLLWATSRGRIKKKVPIPLQKVDYVAASSDGDTVIAYSQERYTFLVLSKRGKSWDVFASRQGAAPGFALYGGRKSSLFFNGGIPYALGYYYDRSGEYLGEWMVRIHPDKKGNEAFEGIVRTSEADRALLQFLPKAKQVLVSGISEKYALLILKNEKDGCLVGFDRAKKEYFLIDHFNGITGCSVSRKGNLCSYVIQPRGSTFSGVLFIYDLEKRSPLKAVPGTFFNPEFEPGGSMVAVGRQFQLTGQTRVSQVMIFKVGEDKTSVITMPGGENPIFWRFNGLREMMIYTGKRIFSAKVTFN